MRLINGKRKGCIHQFLQDDAVRLVWMEPTCFDILWFREWRTFKVAMMVEVMTDTGTPVCETNGGKDEENVG